MELNNINISIDTIDRKISYKDQWGEAHFIPHLNKLYYIVDGEIEIQVNGTLIRAKAGDLVLMPVHTSQSYKVISDSFDHYYCHFHAYINKSALDLFDVKKTVLRHSNQNKTQEFQDMIKKYRSHSCLDLMSAQLMLTQMIIDYMSQTPVSDIKLKPSTQSLNTLIHYINDHLDQQFTVEELASRMDLHPNYFIRLFKSHFGQSPIQYINTMKIHKAKDMLLTTDTTVSELSSMLGYSDVYYFSKLFKKHTSLSPNKFRQ